MKTATAKNVFPEWLRRPWPSGGDFAGMRALLDGLELHTVCQSAHCPNHAECWRQRTATLLALGTICTRDCAFCAVASGVPGPPDPREPEHAAEAVRRLGLRHVVITMVTRDDLEDGGADHLAVVIETIRAVNPGVTVEALTSDFGGMLAPLGRVLEAGLDVFAHNIETVPRLYSRLRDARYDYAHSLGVLRAARELAPETVVKSGLMLGCGETDTEVRATLEDLCAAGCATVAIGQYLQPTPLHAPVVEYAAPERFDRCREMALRLGFRHVAAGPFVRSSYRAAEALRASRRMACDSR